MHPSIQGGKRCGDTESGGVTEKATGKRRQTSVEDACGVAGFRRLNWRV